MHAPAVPLIPSGTVDFKVIRLGLGNLSRRSTKSSRAGAGPSLRSSARDPLQIADLDSLLVLVVMACSIAAFLGVMVLRGKDRDDSQVPQVPLAHATVFALTRYPGARSA